MQPHIQREKPKLGWKNTSGKYCHIHHIVLIWHLQIFFLSDPLKKKHLEGTHFQNEEKIMNAVTEYFDGKCAVYFRDGIFKLLHRWEKSINFNGDHVEK